MRFLVDAYDNRYKKAKPQIAFIHGFGIQNAAIAASCAHDSHNIIALGTEDSLIVKAVNRIIEMKGGLIIVRKNNEEASVPLPIAGLLSPLSIEEVIKQIDHLNDVTHQAGSLFDATFMTLSFMALPVIPALKLSDKGLFDIKSLQFIDLFE